MDEGRDRVIIRTSVIGILANVALAAFKAAVGLATRSVAIVLDAVNNLSDALSSIITIVGARLAAKAPDRKHPMGHGRVEYLSATAIAMLVLYAGLTSLIESIRNILEPELPSYDAPALVIVGVAVVAKIVLGLYVRKAGERVDSDALKASGTDALFDSIISASTLVAAFIFINWGISLEAWLGAFISIVIIKSGVDMLRETLNEILGQRVSPELARSVRSSITSFPEVSGAYDLIVHNYGPRMLVGSVHVEVPEDMTARQLDDLERRMAHKVFVDTGVAMGGISVYARNVGNTEAARIERLVRRALRDRPGVLQLHGFYIDEESRELRFDCVLSFDVADRQAEIDAIAELVQELCPDYEVSISLDFDITDI